MNALSVFESLGLCLYFVGGMVNTEHFADICTPKNITLKLTSSSFAAAFPRAAITNHLRELRKDPQFSIIDAIRNILVHRVIGRRNVHNCSTTDSKGTYTQMREEVWHIPGSTEKPVFDEELIQRHFDVVTCLSTTLISASLEFVKSVKRYEQRH